MKKITFRGMKQTENKEMFKEWKTYHPDINIIATKAWSDDNMGLPCFLVVFYND